MYFGRVKKGLLFLPFLFLAFTSPGQDTRQLWTDFNHGIWTGSALSVHQDLGFRWISTGKSDVYRYVIRQELRYHPGTRMEFRVGFGLFRWMLNQEQRLHEFRPHVGMAFKGSVSSRISHVQLFRAEYRNFDGISDRFRFRYQPKFNVRLSKSESPHDVNWLLHPEFFSSVDQNEILLFSGLRLNTGVSYAASKKLRLELHVIYETFRTNNEIKFPQNHFIMRPRVFWTW